MFNLLEVPFVIEKRVDKYATVYLINAKALNILAKAFENKDSWEVGTPVSIEFDESKLKIIKIGESRHIPILEAEKTDQNFLFSGHVPFCSVWDYNNPTISLLKHGIFFSYVGLDDKENVN